MILCLKTENIVITMNFVHEHVEVSKKNHFCCSYVLDLQYIDLDRHFDGEISGNSISIAAEDVPQSCSDSHNLFLDRLHGNGDSIFVCKTASGTRIFRHSANKM